MRVLKSPESWCSAEGVMSCKWISFRITTVFYLSPYQVPPLWITVCITVIRLESARQYSSHSSLSTSSQRQLGKWISLKFRKFSILIESASVRLPQNHKSVPNSELIKWITSKSQSVSNLRIHQRVHQFQNHNLFQTQNLLSESKYQ